MSSSSTPPEDVPATMDAPSSPSRPKPTRSSTTKSQVSLSNPRPGNLIRKASNSFSQSRPPVGMFHAFGSVGSNIPTLNDIQKGNFNPEGWSGPGQRRNSQAHRESDTEVLELRRQRTMSVAAGTVEKIPVIKEKEDSKEDSDDISGIETGEISTTKVEEDAVITPHDPSIPYANGYQFPPHHTKKQATLIALHGFWNFVTTPFGFLLTLYALNIVAWGGMLFLILIHATPAMAYPSYNALNSPAKIWLEITAQILNALFCVTGLGLIPWRFRDAWFALRWRFDKGKGSEESLRKLAGIHRNWFRLRGSQEVNVLFDPSSFSSSNVENNDDNSLPPNIPPSSLALPISLSPSAPLTGERASPSTYWLLDFVIWMFVLNTFLQIALCGFMWGYNRFERPGAAVGALISLACIVASAAGWVVFREGKRVKGVEGVEVSEGDREILREMREKEGGSGGGGV